MKRMLSVFLALLAVVSASVPVSHGTSSNAVSFITFDESSSIPSSDHPVFYADESYYLSESLPTNLQGQGSYGTCWAFSTVALAEISMIKQGLAESDIDLSEAQVAYNVYHEFPDPMGLMGNDSMSRKSGTWLADGGSLMQSTIALSAWKGLAEESVVPYDDITEDSVLTAEQQTASFGILTNARWFNMSQTDTVKNMITEFGAVSASMYHADKYFNSSTGAYYQNYTSGTNHAITIVGWDDDYSASNFKVTPSGDGAWICRNSWGDWWGLDGYCYISYYDKALSSSKAYSLEMESAERYDNNYQYDGGFYSGAIGLPSGYSFYNTFTATEADGETLEAVGIFLYSADVEYSLQVYDADTGEALLSDPVEGCTAETGYYTVELPNGVSLEEGDRFAVCFTLYSDGGYVYAMVDTSDTTSSSYYKYVADNSNAESCYGYTYGYNEVDVADTYNCCFRIKALTTVNKQVAGDLSGDGSVNLADMFMLKEQLVDGAASVETADVNGDGTVNLADLFAIKKIILL